MNNLKFDLSITISVIIAIAAVISPIFTAIINNAHQRKMKLLELKQEHYEKTVSYQRSIFENYLSKAGIYIGTKCTDKNCLKDYNDAYLLALLYAPKGLREKIQSANMHLLPGFDTNAIDEFEKLIPQIQDHIQHL